MKDSVIKSVRQRGVVLFVALIALVVMSLAAVALIRSVDTNTIIAGNLALKHSALVASDRGVETAIDWLTVKYATPTDLNVDNAGNANDGYYATYLTLDLDDPAVLKDDNTWAANKSAEAIGTGIAGGTETASGNNIRYIIQRMCSDAVAPEAEKCVLGDSASPDIDHSNLPDPELEELPPNQPSPIYRITTRVQGVKNTVSYAQMFVY